MSGQRRSASRVSGALLALAVSLGVAASGCSWSRLDESAPTTVADGMRPVPTVPGPTAPGQEVALDPGTVTTELVGDPQPNPDSADTLPPLPDAPVVNACKRLREYATAKQFGAAVGAEATAESIWDEACRFTAGAGVAEIHYVAEGAVESDWFKRDGIEPVGDVAADAVGIAMYAPPGSETGDGYTIALVSRREGAVVAVRGTADDRAIAGQLANIVESSL